MLSAHHLPSSFLTVSDYVHVILISVACSVQTAYHCNGVFSIYLCMNLVSTNVFLSLEVMGDKN